jgi:hypothetical protein
MRDLLLRQPDVNQVGVIAVLWLYPSLGNEQDSLGAPLEVDDAKR